MNRNFIFIFIICIICSFDNIVFSQEESVLLNKEIAELILRLDTIYDKVLLDTGTSRYLNENLDKYPLEVNILDKKINYSNKNCGKFISIDFEGILKFLPKNNLYLNQWNRDFSEIMDTVHLQKRFSDKIAQIMDIYNNSHSDSLDYLMYLVKQSSHSSLYDSKLNKIMYKRVYIHAIIEFNNYYFVFYHLQFESGDDLGNPLIEIIFKDTNMPYSLEFLISNNCH